MKYIIYTNPDSGLICVTTEEQEVEAIEDMAVAAGGEMDLDRYSRVEVEDSYALITTRKPNQYTIS